MVIAASNHSKLNMLVDAVHFEVDLRGPIHYRR